MVKPSPFQVRSSIGGVQLDELKMSMNEVGQAVPIKVRQLNTHYEIVYGHRRFEAAKQLKWEKIEAIVDKLTDEEAMLQGLAENVQRDDLEPLDEARAYKNLQDKGWSTRKIAGQVGRAQPYIVNLLALLDEPKEIQEIIERREGRPRSDNPVITEGHVRVARGAGLEDEERMQVLKKAANEGLSRDQTQRISKAIKEANTDKLKQQLIEAPFSEHIHDPERIKKLVEERGGIDPLTSKDKTEPKLHEKAVADFLRYIKQMRWWLEEFENAIDNGQVSPEGRPFVSERLKPMRSDIDRILTKLEK